MTIAAVSLAACGDESTGPLDRITGKYSVEESLRLLPDIADSDAAPISVISADVAAIASALDLPDPVDATTSNDWFGVMLGQRVNLLLPQPLQPMTDSAQLRDEIGFDLRDVRSYAAVDSGVGLTVVRLASDVKPKTTGVDADPKGLSVATRDGLVGVSRQPRTLNRWRTNDAPTLADREGFLDVATSLDDRSVQSALISTAPTARNRTPSDGEETSVLPAYDAVGIGWSIEDDEVREFVAYRVDGDANDAVDSFEDVWSEGNLGDTPIVEIVEVEDVATTGDVVVVTLRPLEERGVALGLLERGAPQFVAP